MKGHFTKSINIARGAYGYESPNSTGTLPLGVIVNNKKYVLFTVQHPGVCDTECCQQIL